MARKHFSQLRALVVSLFLAAAIVPTLPGTAHASAPTLTGTVLFGASQQPAVGAQITVHALPINPAEDGTSYSAPIVAQTQTNSLGNFSVTVTATPELIAMADENDGWLGLEARADETTTQSTALNTVSVTYRTVGHTSAQEQDDASSDTGKGFQAVNPLLLTIDETTGQSSVTNGDPSPNPQPGPNPCTQSRKVTATADPDTIVIGEYHAYWDVSGKFTLNKTSETWLGVGYSHSAGPWHVSGSIRVGTTVASEVYANRSAAFGKQMTSKFHYIKESISYQCSDSSKNYTDTEIRSTKWTGGMKDGNDVSSWDGYDRWNTAHSRGYDAPFDHDTGFTTTAHKAYNYTAQISVFGVQLSAETDYSNRVEVTWNFGHQPYEHYIFGTDGPPTTATVIYSY